MTISYKFIGVAALVVVAGYLGYKARSDQLANWISKYNNYVQSAQQTTKYADSLKKQVTILNNVVVAKDSSIASLNVSVGVNTGQRKQLQSQIQELNARLSTVVFDSAANVPQIIAIKDTIIGNLNQQLIITDAVVVKKDSIISFKDQQLDIIKRSAALATMRGDSLQTIVLNLPKAPPNPNKIFGFIPKPGRVVVFIVGAVAGAYIEHKLVK